MERGKVVDLMEALKASIQATKQQTKAAAAKSARTGEGTRKKVTAGSGR